MGQTFNQSLKQTGPVYMLILYTFLGAIFLAFISQVVIHLPQTPIPITLQVFGIFLLVLLQGGYKACLSVFIYLLLATCGFPVLADGKTSSFWMTQPDAGYLFGFLLAAWLSSWLIKQKEESSDLWVIFSLMGGLIAILFLGTVWLAYFVGMHQALNIGLWPFILGGILKILLAFICAKLILIIKNWFILKGKSWQQ